MPIINIKNNSLLEMKGKESITDKHLKELIDECEYEIMSKTNYKLPRFINYKLGETTNTNGSTFWPQWSEGNFTIVLNKHLIGEPDNLIKTTICHELCHVITNQELIDDETVYWDWDDYKGRECLYRNRFCYDKTRDGSHGTRWKRVADDVNKALNLNPPISRLNNSHYQVQNYKKSKAKYIVKCTKCGNKWYYQKASAVIKNLNRCKCPYCNTTTLVLDNEE